MEQLLKTLVRYLDNKANNSDDEEEEHGKESEKKVAEECILVDMDFAENYEIVHKVSIQSEHWCHQQVTLYIVITHFKSEGKWKSEAHVFVSADHAHDTFFTQRALAGDLLYALAVFWLCSGCVVYESHSGNVDVMCSALAEHFKARGIQPQAWYFNTDGAPSHFKNRFTMQSMFNFKTKTGATTVLWETCAPGHGKGPWDGIGAVIKRFMRKLEKNSKIYACGARDVFLGLLEHFQKSKVGSHVVISDFVFHYILSPGEPVEGGAINGEQLQSLEGCKNVWSHIKRPSARPAVTSIPGIRSSFCFRVGRDNTLHYRELSCRCRPCMEHRWTQCSDKKVAGTWKSVVMKHTAASAVVRTRGQRFEISKQRQTLARQCKMGEIIAMESAEDVDGFSFWLARVEGVAYKYTGPQKTEHGRTFVPNTWYIKVRYFDRYPRTSSSTFKLGTQTHAENVEGVISRSVQHADAAQGVRRSARRSSSSAPPVISLTAQTIEGLNDAPSLDSL